mgnify:CR=1 FL=1
MKFKIFALLLVGNVLLPMAVPAQTLESIDGFDAELHLNLKGCFGASIGENLACLSHALETCHGFTNDLSTAGGYYYCSYVAFEKVDAELNRHYSGYVNAAAQNAWGEVRRAESEELLRAAQRAWVSYRDAMCEVSPRWSGIGPGFDAVVDDCRSRLTLMQLETLSSELGGFNHDQ